MKVDPSQTALVIAGSWNQAIFQPAWVGEKLFGVPKIVGTAALLATGGIVTEFTSSGLTLACTPGRMEFRPGSTDSSSLSRTESIAGRLLELLPETPVSAFGMNFHFTAASTDSALVKLFELADEALLGRLGPAEETTMSRKVATDSCISTITLARLPAEFRVSMNHSYAVHSGRAEEALRLLPGTVVRAWETSQKFASEVQKQ